MTILMPHPMYFESVVILKKTFCKQFHFSFLIISTAHSSNTLMVSPFNFSFLSSYSKFQHSIGSKKTCMLQLEGQPTKKRFILFLFKFFVDKGISFSFNTSSRTKLETNATSVALNCGTTTWTYIFDKPLNQVRIFKSIVGQQNHYVYKNFRISKRMSRQIM